MLGGWGVGTPYPSAWPRVARSLSGKSRAAIKGTGLVLSVVTKATEQEHER